MIYIARIAVGFCLVINCFGCTLDGSSCFNEKEKSSLSKDCYIDPKEYFSIYPPAQWKVNISSDSPLASVEITGPGSVSLSVYAKWVGPEASSKSIPKISSFDTPYQMKALSLEEFLDGPYRTSIEYRDARFKKDYFSDAVDEITINGEKVLSENVYFFDRYRKIFNVLHEEVLYTLTYLSGTKMEYDRHLKVASDSLKTFLPFKGEVSDEEKKQQKIEDHKNEAFWFMHHEEYGFAEIPVNSILKLSPHDQTALKLKRVLDSLPQEAKK